MLRHIDLEGDDPRWFRVLVQSVRYWGADQRPASDRGNWLEVLRMLLDHGVDPNVASGPDQNLTMLHTVVSRNGPISESERVAHAAMLLDKGADLRAIDRNLQSTPLGWASRWGKTELVGLYLDHDADPNLAGEPWAKPLVWAEKYGHGDISAVLRGRGATGISD
ncbi:MAG: ankyrin repeat domain-containing protein [Candidatus Latescibacteria bacterium]|nr:ankyrin repeat domain-containing protein [Candidatus Latescibacterota bacterium]